MLGPDGETIFGWNHTLAVPHEFDKLEMGQPLMIELSQLVLPVSGEYAWKVEINNETRASLTWHIELLGEKQ